MRVKRASAALACALALTIAACGDNGPNVPTAQNVAGTYMATTFLATTGGVTTNLLTSGASVTLILGADGTTSGRLFVPASVTPQVDAPLTGTWTFFNATDIDIASNSDTFLRDMLFTVSGNTLVGDQTFNATRIQIVLTKQ
jgi:predicted small lipoprotein YifL